VRSIARGRFNRLAVAALTIFAVAWIPSSAQAASGCPGAGNLPAQLSASALRATTLCVLNQQRAAHGVRPLRRGARLVTAARRHSRAMVARRFFAHDSLSGAGFSQRIARTGWMRGRNGWFVGENLAWGTGARSTPQATVAAWMASPAHRRNVLQPRFRVIGIGVAAGVPVPGGAVGATYTTDFGS
jgi:uncharacterized protein YkwD